MASLMYQCNAAQAGYISLEQALCFSCNSLNGRILMMSVIVSMRVHLFLQVVVKSVQTLPCFPPAASNKYVMYIKYIIYSQQLLYWQQQQQQGQQPKCSRRLSDLQLRLNRNRAQHLKRLFKCETPYFKNIFLRWTSLPTFPQISEQTANHK